LPQRRSATYNKEDLQRLKAEGEEVEPVLCAAFTAGSASDSDETMVAKAHRQHITLWFYDCSYDVHRGMTDMYVPTTDSGPTTMRWPRVWPDSSGKRPTPTPTVPVLSTKPTLTHVERIAKGVCITATLLCRCSR